MNAATVSKFIHFLSPEIFPIIDANIAKNIKITESKGAVNISAIQYAAYIDSICQIRDTEKQTWRKLKEAANEKSISTIRLIDNLLFRE